jgi:restriction endonuclease S subunit
MWKTVKLGEIAKPVGGSGFPKKYQGDTEGEIPFFKVSDMNLPENEKFMSSANNYVSRETLRFMKGKAYPAGTIIFPKIGGAISTNKKRILTREAAFDNNVMGLVPNEEISSEYLYKFFLNLDLYEISNKAALPSITATSVKEIDIHLPPLAEQQRIVAKLDAAFAEIDRAIEISKNKQVEAASLYAKTLGIYLTQEAGAWKKARIGDVCHLVNGSTPSRKEERYWKDGDIPWFTIDDLREQGRDIQKTTQKVTKAAVTEKKVKLIPANSVLLCCTASIGEAAIARTEMATNQQFNALTPKTDELLPEYLYYVATTLKEALLRVSGSTTISFVSMGKLKGIEIPLPPLTVQRQIASSLEELSARTQNLSDIHADAIKNFSTLKSAILAQELQPPQREAA